MGNVHVNRGRLAPTLILVALVVLAVVAGLGMTAGPASAHETFTTCASCHGMSATHSQTAHVTNGVYKASDLTTCVNCHPNGDTSQVPLPSKCAVCHGGVTAILASAQHVTNGCGTTAGCHGVPPVVATTTMTEKVKPTTIKLKKSVTVSGTAGPTAALAGAKVALKAELKVGKKWTKAKTGTATVSTGGTYSWKYTPKKKGSYRVTASIAATSTYTAKSMVKTFKVK